MESITPNSALEHIQHVIVLMFENRSFDNTLGAMPQVNGLLEGGSVKPGLYNTMHPRVPAGPGNPAVFPTPIVPGSAASLQSDTTHYEAQWITNDFNHDFGDGNTQDLYGPGTTGILNGQPQNNPQTTYPSSNSGFLVTNPPPSGSTNAGVLSYFAWESMKVFHTLASSFVVCDAWHCDMPGHTSPNRAFMHCATTGDLGINDDDSVGQTRMVNRQTIFERIQEQGTTWKLYSPNAHCDTNWLNKRVLSQQYDPNCPLNYNVTNVPIKNFFSDLSAGTLPFYSFLMCWNDIQNCDTSMHPASSVVCGENYLACVYNALKQSPFWENTLLIVNFDENGGMYDHVVAPTSDAPDFDPKEGQQPPVSTWTTSSGTTYSYDFTTLGVRIPVMLISPWLKAGVCTASYQNTSVPRFLQDLLPDPDNQCLWLTQRDRNAPSLAPLFGYDQFGCTTPRTDCPADIQGYTQSENYPYVVDCRQIMCGNELTEEQLAAAPSPHIVQITRQYLGPLPGHPDSGKPLTKDFATVGEMRAYSQERMDAAQAALKQTPSP